jgi:hypothetical protein
MNESASDVGIACQEDDDILEPEMSQPAPDLPPLRAGQRGEYSPIGGLAKENYV